MFRDRFYVFTRNPDYYLFKYLDKNWRDFYQIELSSRKRLDLPPYRYLAKITCRQKNENNLFLKVTRLYNSLKEKGLDVYGPLKEMPFKLRGNFRYYVIIKAKTRAPLLKIIKQEMKNLKSGGLKTAVVIK